MKTQDSDYILEKALNKCAQSGAKLTHKRRQILKILVEANAALSAYDVVERYNQGQDQKIQPMSAYRILDFLVGENLAHKLSTANQYIVCEHIACDHQHANSHFLICKSCQKVNEIYLNSETVELLSNTIEQAGFHLSGNQFELKCLCDDCKNKDTKEHS